MFASFLFPYRFREIAAPHLWVMYKQITNFSPNEILFIGSEDYFRDPLFYRDNNRWEMTKSAQYNSEFDIPSHEIINEYIKFSINSSIFDELAHKRMNHDEIMKYLLTERFTPLEKELDNILSNSVQRYDIKAALAWINTPSLIAAAQKHGLKVIHNELGPLRKPFYHDTAYFDFKGVNGNTESAERFDHFRKNITSSVEILSRQEISDLVVNDQGYMDYDNEPKYEIGIPLQVENDSNILAYSKGLNNIKLIETVKVKYNRDTILIRKHPGGLRDYPDSLADLDYSKNSIEFLKKCKRIATINSSVGLEALLFGKETYILGDSPFAFAAGNKIGNPQIMLSKEECQLALNFFIFCYIIPYELLYEPNYIFWRLTGPSEKEIFLFNLNHYRKRKTFIQEWMKFRQPSDKKLLRFCMKQKYINIENLRQIEELKMAIDNYQKTVDDLQYYIYILRNSISWQIMKPMRFLERILRNTQL